METDLLHSQENGISIKDASFLKWKEEICKSPEAGRIV